MIGGTRGSLAIPTLDVWTHAGAPDWMRSMARERLAVVDADPLARQLANLCDVVRGRAAPVAAGTEGLATLRVLLAAKQAAASGHTVELR